MPQHSTSQRQGRQTCSQYMFRACKQSRRVVQICLVGSRHFNTFGSHGSAAHVPLAYFATLDECCTWLRQDKGMVSIACKQSPHGNGDLASCCIDSRYECLSRLLPASILIHLGLTCRVYHHWSRNHRHSPGSQHAPISRQHSIHARQ